MDICPHRDNQSDIIPNVPKLRRIVAPTLAIYRRVRHRRQLGDANGGGATQAERILEALALAFILERIIIVWGINSDI